MNRRSRILTRSESGVLVIADSHGRKLARFKSEHPTPPFRRLRLYEQPSRAARVAKGVAVFVVLLAFAALISVDDYEPTRPPQAQSER